MWRNSIPRDIFWSIRKQEQGFFLLSNDDENKVFCIGFRTPPSDSTGVAHILEHSVLCGSEKIPGEGSICGARQGILKHLFKRHDLPG